MHIGEYVRWLNGNPRHRTVRKAVVSLIFNLLFAFYNGILGALSSSVIFAATSVYYLLLCTMRFVAILLHRKTSARSDRQAATVIGVSLIVLCILFQAMVLISMKYKTAAAYGTVPMITIAFFTFIKITTATVQALKHRRNSSKFIKAINAVRCSEVAVSLLTMQQSMLVSFGDRSDRISVILNACTGASVCIFIMTLGIITLKNNRKE